MTSKTRRLLPILSACGFLIIMGIGFAADLTYSVSWVGNSFSGKDRWAPQDVAALFVDGDGTLFTNVPWEEGGANVQEYKDGQFVASASHTHGWGYQGGDAIAANSNYVFIAQKVENEGGHLSGDSWPPAGSTWWGVSRRDRADMTKGASFAGGHGKEGDVLPGSFLPVAEKPTKQTGTIRGLWATETRLYVSDTFDQSIKVYDTETMAAVASWPAAAPDRLCLDAAGHLWVLLQPQGDGPWRIVSYDENGTVLRDSITLPAGSIPTAMCFDATGRLLIADAGPDQDIKIYRGTALAGTFGVKGGIYAPPLPGAFGDLRFHDPTGIGADSAGNIYVASSEPVGGGSTVLERYSKDGRMTWRIEGLTFVDNGAIDPGAETELYTKDKHFKLDYNQSDGAEWSYAGYTVDPWKFPDDPRLHLRPTHTWLERINGKKFLFVSDMVGEFLHVYRFDEKAAETVIPCALFTQRHATQLGDFPPHQPDAGESIWRDANGDGHFDADEFETNGGKDFHGTSVPDDKGGIWSTDGKVVRYLPIKGVEKNGVPLWSYADLKIWPVPGEFDSARRVHYMADKDVLILAGNKGEDHNQHWKPMGPVLAAYDHWLAPGGPSLRGSIVLPLEKGAAGHFSHEPISFDVAGDYLFVAYTQGLAAEHLKNAFVRVYRWDDLSFVGNLSAEGQIGDTGLLDLVESVRAFRRSNGEYVVLLEDDAKAKMIMFRWKP